MGAAGIMRLEPGNGAAPHAPALAGHIPLFLGTFLAVTVLQRFAVPGTGQELGLGFAVCLALVTTAVFRGVLVVSLPRLVLYVVAACALTLTLFARDRPFSILSFAMLLTLYASFALAVELTRAEYLRILEMFQRVMMLCAACALVQFAVQVPFGPAAMFPLDAVLPPQLFIQGFNLRIPIADGALLKSTGLWFLEPSHVAQFLAVAILVELAFFRRLVVLALLGGAYVVTFSGTGIILLAATLLVLLVLHGRVVAVLLILAAAAVVVLVLSDVPPFSLFFERVDEFANTRSSGWMRFAGPWWFFTDVVAARPDVLLFGLGPGAWSSAAAHLDYAVQDTGWLKLVTEYGLVGAVPFLLFYLWSLFRRSPEPVLSVACLVQFLFLGGYLNAFYVQFLAMALVVWPRLTTPEPATAPAGIRMRPRSAGLGDGAVSRAARP